MSAARRITCSPCCERALATTYAFSTGKVTVQPQPRVRSILALAWTKALRRSWLLEKAVELETAGVWFWQAERSQGQLPEEVKEHWQAQCIAGAKQSGAAWLPELRCLPGGLTQLTEQAAACEGRYVLLEDGEQARPLDMSTAGAPGTAVFVLGPEGGFATSEREALHAAGFIAVNLGQRILRWETAALLCLGLRWWAGQQ